MIVWTEPEDPIFVIQFRRADGVWVDYATERDESQTLAEAREKAFARVDQHNSWGRAANGEPLWRLIQRVDTPMRRIS